MGLATLHAPDGGRRSSRHQLLEAKVARSGAAERGLDAEPQSGDKKGVVHSQAAARPGRAPSWVSPTSRRTCTSWNCTTRGDKVLRNRRHGHGAFRLTNRLAAAAEVRHVMPRTVVVALVLAHGGVGLERETGRVGVGPPKDGCSPRHVSARTRGRVGPAIAEGGGREVEQPSRPSSSTQDRFAAVGYVGRERHRIHLPRRRPEHPRAPAKSPRAR